MKKLKMPERAFEFVALIVGGVFLLRPEDAKAFVRECEKRELKIAGIEGFRVFEGPKFQPIQEISTDLGESGYCGNTCTGWARSQGLKGGPARVAQCGRGRPRSI